MKNNMNIKSIIISLVLVAALAGGMYLVSQNQETRRGAYFSGSKILILPVSSNVKVLDSVPIQLWVDTANNAKVSAVDSTICYGTHVGLDATDVSTLIDLNTEAFKVIEYSKNSANCLRFVAVSSGIGPEKLKSGLVKVASIRFKALSAGNGSFTLSDKTTKVNGYNPAAGATDSSIQISEVTSANYSIIGPGDPIVEPTIPASCHQQCPGDDGVLRSCTPPEADGTAKESLCNSAGRVEVCGNANYCCPSVGGAWTKDMTKCPTVTEPPVVGGSPMLNYKVSFGGVNPTAAQCAVNWPLQFIILGGGESKVYSNVIPPTQTVIGNKLVFSGSLVLTGFTKTNNVAVFIKGPKSLQVKYGVNNQSSPYNKAGGEIVLTKVFETSPQYDFSNYPLTPGDILGVNSEVQDGWINGVDFSYVKSKSLVHETVNTGGYLKGDLDGNCQVNSNDVNLLKISLQEKQGQLY